MSVLPHALPYLLFVALGALCGFVPAAIEPWMDPLRTIAVGAALLVFWRRRRYPELATCEATGPVKNRHVAALLAIAAGVAIGLLWVPLSNAVPLVGSDARAGFDPHAPHVLLRVIFRIVGTVLLVPLAEELFVRSFLPRRIDADRGWRDHAIGVFTPMSFAVSVGFFTLTHPEWLAAVVTAVLWTLLLMATRRFRDVVFAHAIANALLAYHVLSTGEWQWW